MNILVDAIHWTGLVKMSKKNQSFKLPIALMLIQIVILALSMLLVFKTTGLSVADGQISFLFSQNPMDYMMLLISATLFIAIYFSSKEKNPEFFERQKAVSKDVKEMIKFELKRAKSEPKVPALVLIQFCFVFALFVAIAAYIDPGWELIDWAARGVEEPLKTILNIFIFALVSAAFIVIYRHTANFRK